jgi:amidophosphoribosyltransferase
MGVDMATREELVAANKTVDEIAAHIEVDSLGYLSIAGMEEAVNHPLEGHCAACFSGHYPLDLDQNVGKYALEN